MNLILSDTELPSKLPSNNNNHYIDLNKMKIGSCIGCFGCWVKTPGKCVIRDDAVKIYPLIAQSENIIYVTRLWYGSYDELMKTILERSIPIQQAFIRLHKNETHHVQRNVVGKKAVIIAYGDISEKEQTIFRKLVARNAQNMSFLHWEIHFITNEEIEKTILSEVNIWENC